VLRAASLEFRKVQTGIFRFMRRALPPPGLLPAQKKLWSRELGEGYGVTVDGGVLYTMCGHGNQEVVLAADAASGKTLWERPQTSSSSASEEGERLGPALDSPGAHRTHRSLQVFSPVWKRRIRKAGKCYGARPL
jgi:hypothetical protein